MNEKAPERCNPILISSTLLGSANDLLEDHFRKNNDKEQSAQKANILSIIANIESNVARIKDRLETEYSDVTKGDFPSYPPPPFIPTSHQQKNESLKKPDEEEDESLSTISSNSIKEDEDEKKSALHVAPNKKVAEHSVLLSPINEVSASHDRRQSRRLSLPYLAQDIDEPVRYLSTKTVCSLRRLIISFLFKHSFFSTIQIEAQEYHRRGSINSLFNRMRRKSSTSIHPARISMLQDPSKISSKLIDANQNWKLVRPFH